LRSKPPEKGSLEFRATASVSSQVELACRCVYNISANALPFEKALNFPDFITSA
jgi:hypothetical protein